MTLIALICVVALLVLIQGFFSGSETVFTSTSKAFVHNLAAKGDPRAEQIRTLLSHTERFLGTTLTGTNLALVSSTTLCQILVSRYVMTSPAFDRFCETVAVPWNWEYIVNTFTMTPLILVLAELVPKTIGRAHADSLALRLVRPLSVAGIVLGPLVWVIGRVAQFFAWAVGGGTPGSAIPSVTRDDLRAITELAAEQKLVPEAAAAMLQAVFDVDRKPVSSVMVPLVDVASVPAEATLADVETLAAETGYARFPVYQNRVDEIVGIVSLRHLLYARDEDGCELPPDALIAPYVRRNITFIPETKPVGSLLQELRYQHIPMAVVVDEHGGVVGILTLEDLVEEIVGDIYDERDRPAHELAVTAPGTVECSGKVAVDDLEQHLGVAIPKDGFETAAGLALKLAGRIPRAGEIVRGELYDVEILAVEHHRVTRLRFRRRTGADQGEGADVR